MIKEFCDKCKNEIKSVWERQEKFTINFRAGYGSVFGDGNAIKVDLCQNCLHNILEKEGLLNENTVREVDRGVQVCQLS